ncbi:MAG: FAD-dependent oxidoreductase [Gammaproteobacteria bacterium]|nr:FAD-dependent oxidoreductase [Gammaproteobacteria bacterium]
MQTMAIIGAGLAGITAARGLKGKAQIRLFEKSRGVGGRLATRWADPFYFDHGAQFFKAHSPEFKAFLAPWIEQGLVARWDARFVEINEGQIQQQRQWDQFYPHYVGVPSMNTWAKAMAEGLDIQLNTRVDQLSRVDNTWQLFDEQGACLGCFDWVIMAIPAPQAQALLPESVSFAQSVAKTQMLPCFSLMLGFDEPLPLPFDAALVRGVDISWISVNSSKPGRAEPMTLLINSTNRWAGEHIDDDTETVIAHLCQETGQVIGQPVDHAVHQVIHGWRYANLPKQNTSEPFLIDEQRQIAACGDWLIQGRVNAAFTSGFELANRLLTQFD